MIGGAQSDIVISIWLTFCQPIAFTFRWIKRKTGLWALAETKIQRVGGYTDVDYVVVAARANGSVLCTESAFDILLWRCVTNNLFSVHVAKSKRVLARDGK